MQHNAQLTVQHDNPSLMAMAARCASTPESLLQTLKATVFKEARNDSELAALIIVANQHGLNPLTKEIYAFPAKGGGIVPVVSIDGWLRIMNDHPQFNGISYEWEHANERLISCTAVIQRKDRDHPVRVTEYLAECKRATDPWKMEHRMLRHKATIQCARVAFGFSGIVDEDEALGVPGLAGERESTPAHRARAVPHDPFAHPATQVEPQPQVIEAETVPLDEPAQHEPSIEYTDAIAKIQDAKDAGELNDAAAVCSGLQNEDEKENAKTELRAQAEKLGLRWSNAAHGFVKKGGQKS